MLETVMSSDILWLGVLLTIAVVCFGLYYMGR